MGTQTAKQKYVIFSQPMHSKVSFRNQPNSQFWVPRLVPNAPIVFLRLTKNHIILF